MIYIHKLKQDCTIIQNNYINTGGDPILELREDTHCLIDFSNIFQSNNNYILNLTIANAYNLNNKDNIQIFPILYNWSEGIGKIDYTPIITNDSNWYYRQDDILWVNEGGDIDDYGYTENIGLVYNNKILYDLEYIKSNIPNGILLKWTNEQLTSKQLLIYSKDTHTIFYPKIIESEPQLFMSNKPKVPNDMYQVYEINPGVKHNSVQRFRFSANDLYPQKDFSETTNYIKQYNLPETSYISLLDYATKDIIIPFNNNIKLDCDSISNYIDIDLTNLVNDRYYEIWLKIKTNKIENIFKNFVFYIQ